MSIPNGMDITPRLADRYLNDAVFHAMVDSIVASTLANELTAGDWIDAIRCADPIIRERQLRRLSREGTGEK